jgi:hypothetical protein
MIIYPDGTLQWESAVQSSDSHDSIVLTQARITCSPLPLKITVNHGITLIFLFLTLRGISSMIGVTTRICMFKSIRLSSTTGVIVTKSAAPYLNKSLEAGGGSVFLTKNKQTGRMSRPYSKREKTKG